MHLVGDEQQQKVCCFVMLLYSTFSSPSRSVDSRLDRIDFCKAICDSKSTIVIRKSSSLVPPWYHRREGLEKSEKYVDTGGNWENDKHGVPECVRERKRKQHIVCQGRDINSEWKQNERRARQWRTERIRSQRLLVLGTGYEVSEGDVDLASGHLNQ